MADYSFTTFRPLSLHSVSFASISEYLSFHLFRYTGRHLLQIPSTSVIGWTTEEGFRNLLTNFLKTSPNSCLKLN
jgi:hypothetical protein